MTAHEFVERAKVARQVASEYAAWGEANGRLHEAVFSALQQAGIGRLYLPSGLGGAAVHPRICAAVCETLADGDPSAGWFVMVFNAARLMASQWPQAMVEHIWGDAPDTLVAASGHTPFQGRPVEGGYMVSGRNSFVSGCHFADYVMSPMLVEQQPHTVVVPAAEVVIQNNWDTLGMRATGSDDVVVENVFVPSVLVTDQQATNTPHPSYRQDNLYHCPSRVVFATYVPVALSLAKRALLELENLAKHKVPYASDAKLSRRAIAQVHYGKAVAIYRSARAYFLEALDEVWTQAQAQQSFSDRQRADLYLAGTHVMQSCAAVVRHVADAAGSSMFDKAQPLERIARDMETLRHHGFANESRYGSVAQVHWEVELDYPLLLR